MNKLKKVLAVLLAVSAIGGGVSVPALTFADIPCFAVEEANTVTVDNITYKISDNGIVATPVKVSDNKVTSLKIPADIDGAKVFLDNPYIVFGGCKNLESFEVEEGNESYCSVDGVIFSKNGGRLLYYPRGRKGSYVIPEGTKYIETGAFYQNEGLTEITLPESLQQVGTKSFFSCTALEKINGIVPGTIGSGFAGCSSLKRIEFAEATNEEDAVLSDVSFSNCLSLEELVIPDSRYIEGRLDISGTSLKELTLPKVTNVNYFSLAIAGCSQLEKVTAFGNVKKIECDESQKNKVKVYGYAENSVLVSACKESGLTFVPIEYIVGDYFRDGVVDVIDVLALNQTLVGIFELSDYGKVAGDVNHDGFLDDADAMKILKSLVKLETLE